MTMEKLTFYITHQEQVNGKKKQTKQRATRQELFYQPTQSSYIREMRCCLFSVPLCFEN